ncbi:resolvase [Sphingopyxis terrae subsp. terrae NBRC 15098]|uniref:Resolvase n=1 Tax=Sphingopyxis terrae subsp. terrae NBRC 15098 TaxID=1219058 RepID=A0A142VX86_9SPHN|nr:MULTISPECIES: DUF4402 domain-containing protein [Sphingopyxis]AMU94384.1 resolvase [Sphingopyxis terrae subsp. terrae NBRC 15098]QXF10796.1 DUF4402 domain-containing protein [Sphingopyxis terrae subsp. terrae]
MRLLLALLLFGAPPAPLAAQCQLCRQDGKDAAIVARKASMPLRVEVDTQLDLGRVAVGASGGEIEIDPLTGARRLRGDVRDLGGFAVTGVVTVSGEPGAEVRVTLPPSVDLESGSGASARVTGLATDLGAAPRLGPDGRLVFRFGGRLQVAGATDGDYRGRIPVTVEYP